MYYYKKEQCKKNITEITYCTDNNMKFACYLFDLLGFRENILIDFFRCNLYNEVLSDFQKKVPCKIIPNALREDIFCLFIPKIQSNMQLYEFLDKCVQVCEFLYVPLEVCLETFLYNAIYGRSGTSIKSKLSKSEFVVGEEYMSLYFDKDYFDDMNIKSIVNEWENTFVKTQDSSDNPASFREILSVIFSFRKKAVRGKEEK